MPLVSEQDSKMHITASWEGGEEVVEVDEGCRSVAALLATLAAALPELDAEKVCLEIGGCEADGEAVCALCEGCVVTVSVTPAARAVATLCAEGCDVDVAGFCCAAQQGKMRLCRLYLEAGVACGLDCSDMSPLLFACRSVNLELCKLLVDGGCALQGPTGHRGPTPLHRAVEAQSVELCELLINSGCAVDVRTTLGYTPLHSAAWYGFSEACRLLIDRGCAIDVQSGLGDTPLHLAVHTKSVVCAKLLLDSGCATNVKNNDGKTPLGLAATAGSTTIHKLLTDPGAKR